MKRWKKFCVVGIVGVLAFALTGCGQQAEEVIGEAEGISVSGNGMDTGKETVSGNEVISGIGTTSGNEIFPGNEVVKENTIPSEDEAMSEAAEGGGEPNMETKPLRPEPPKVKGIYVSGPIAGHSRMEELIALVEETELNAMVIDIKNDDGRITYKMQSDTVLEIGAGINYIRDIEALVQTCKEKDIYLIARIVAFRDPYLAEKKPELAIRTTSGAIFRDKDGLAWVNPYNKEVWDYLMEVSAEAAEVGFDEIQFDYIRFSTEAKEGRVDFGPEAEGISKTEIITEFTEYAYEQLAPLGVYVSADVFGTVIDNEYDQTIVGQDYAAMAEHLDYICPMVYPSHYANGVYGIKVPDAQPYDTIYAASRASVEALSQLEEAHQQGEANQSGEGNSSGKGNQPEATYRPEQKVRVWLQSFTASWVPGHISYGPEAIRAQIKGAYDAGYEEWILWNAGMKYQPDSLLTDEESEAERAKWDAEKE